MALRPQLTEVQLIELLANADAAAVQRAERVSVSTDALLGLLALSNLEAVLEVRMEVTSVAQIFNGTTKHAEMMIMKTEADEKMFSGRLELVVGPAAFHKVKEKSFYKVTFVPEES